MDLSRNIKCTSLNLKKTPDWGKIMKKLTARQRNNVSVIMFNGDKHKTEY